MKAGPSFEERVSRAAADFRSRARATETEQRQILAEAVGRAKARPMESQPRPKSEEPESVEERTKRGRRKLALEQAEYARQAEETLHRMRTREPLFKVSEVNKCVDDLKQRQKERKKELQDDERQRWEALKSLQFSVLNRPLLVEAYERPPKPLVHRAKAIYTPPEDPLDKKIRNAMSSKSFSESGWCADVAAIKDRQNARPKLHEIPYPPKVCQPRSPPEDRPTEIDLRMGSAVQQGWFKGSDWAREVQKMKEKQDSRPRLHEIAYPPKTPKKRQ